MVSLEFTKQALRSSSTPQTLYKIRIRKKEREGDGGNECLNTQ